MDQTRRTAVIVLVTMLTVAGCGASETTPSPSTSPAADSNATPVAASPTASLSAASPTAAADPFQGAVVKTVSDRLRARSQPRVSDDSLKYEPLLPLGTELQVVDGPVEASGYTWYEVEPIVFRLADGVRRAWVAAADHDGTPWLGVAEPAIAGLETATSDVSRVAADPDRARSAATSVDAFGIDLYRRMLADPDFEGQNLVVSPASIALALGMVRAGAKGQTAAQIDDVLHSEGRATFGRGLGSLQQELSSRDGTYQDDEGHSHQLALKIANSSFAQRGWSLEPSFLDEIARLFGSGQQLVDYAADPDAARQTINAWVSRQTAGRIPQLLTPNDVSIATRLYLVNAIYLKANWLRPFEADETVLRPFHRSATETLDVPTMRLRGGQEVPYVTGDGWRATELRYRGAGDAVPLAMTLIMPDDLAAFEAHLSGAKILSIAAALGKERSHLTTDVSDPQPEDCGSYPYSVSLFMPKFSIQARAQLKELLAGLGMPDAFDPAAADFSGIHAPTESEGSIFIGNVIYQATIDVDEKGTEAAAATAIGMDTGGCTGPQPSKEITLRLDHPFFFALRDLESGAILFAGRVVNPAAR
jgi:serine protease inhibitor